MFWKIVYMVLHLKVKITFNKVYKGSLKNIEASENYFKKETGNGKTFSIPPFSFMG